MNEGTQIDEGAEVANVRRPASILDMIVMVALFGTVACAIAAAIVGSLGMGNAAITCIAAGVALLSVALLLSRVMGQGQAPAVANVVPSGESGAVTKKRINILFIVRMIFSVSVIGGIVCGIVASALAATGHADKALVVIVAGVALLSNALTLFGTFGEKLIGLDSLPFDATKAAHERELAQIGATKEIKTLELQQAHEYRNADNEFRMEALRCAAGAQSAESAQS